MRPLSHRILSLDLLRSAAIVSMIAFHLLWDISAFGGPAILDHLGMIAVVWGRVTAAVFLLLVGVSFMLSHERHREKYASFGSSVRKYATRSLQLLACAMMITVVTYAYDPDTFIRFGILHMIAVAIFLLPFAAPLGKANIGAGLALIALGFTLRDATSMHAMLLPLGLPPPGFSSVDYYPILPWLGVVLLGAGLAPRIVPLAHAVDRRLGRASGIMTRLAWPGRHALAIYLVHQPVLICLLALREIL